MDEVTSRYGDDEVTSRHGDVFADERVIRWVRRQWGRYDKFIDSYTKRDSEPVKKALCLAFVRSVLDDEDTERLLTEYLSEVTMNMTSECGEVLGKENVSDTKAHFLLFLWSLPYRSWQQTMFKMLREYSCRDVTHPMISFRNVLCSTLKSLATKVANPLADMIEPWL